MDIKTISTNHKFRIDILCFLIALKKQNSYVINLFA